jgi:hypothetical protein
VEPTNSLHHDEVEELDVSEGSGWRWGKDVANVGIGIVAIVMLGGMLQCR